MTDRRCFKVDYNADLTLGHRRRRHNLVEHEHIRSDSALQCPSRCQLPHHTPAKMSQIPFANDPLAQRILGDETSSCPAEERVADGMSALDLDLGQLLSLGAAIAYFQSSKYWLGRSSLRSSVSSSRSSCCPRRGTNMTRSSLDHVFGLVLSASLVSRSPVSACGV